MPALPPLRSHITRSSAIAGADIAIIADADKPRASLFNVFESLMGFLP
jgi:hypothetical protein